MTARWPYRRGPRRPRATLRNLRRLCARELADRSDPAIVALARVTALTAAEPWPEHAALMLLNRAREAAAANPVTWHTALHRLMDQWDAARRPAEAP